MSARSFSDLGIHWEDRVMLFLRDNVKMSIAKLLSLV